MRNFAIFTLFAFLFSSCATSPTRLSSKTDELALQHGFQKELVTTDPFVLTTYSRLEKIGEPVHIYIEGDGYAWVTPSRVSGNPTPRNPMVLSLAMQDSSANVVYLARPCQYTPEEMNAKFDEFYWTQGRFSEPVVKSMDEAVSHFVQKTQSKDVDLIGYSGGAAVAILIAARRDDVKSIRTIAGNLDPQAVNKYHGVSPLEGSLNPIDYTDKIKNIPMRHFVGTKDKIIPSFVALSFADRTGDSSHQSVSIVSGATHSQGWSDRWREFLSLELHHAGG